MAALADGNAPLLDRMADAHCLFETIHPFADGNGRTGRILMLLMLRLGGIEPALCPSAVLRRSRGEYCRCLEDCRGGDPGPFRALLRHSLEEQASASAGTLARLLAFRAEALSDIENQTEAGMLESLLSNPYFTASGMAESLGVSRTTATRAMRRLAERGIVRRERGVRGLYVSPPVVSILDPEGFGRLRRRARGATRRTGCGTTRSPASPRIPRIPPPSAPWPAAWGSPSP